MSGLLMPHHPLRNITAAAAAKSLQSCLTLCDHIDGSPPGSPAPGILQAKTLEWVAISFSSAWKWKVKVKSLSRVWLLVTPWTAAYQAPPSLGFSRQKYWSGVPLLSPQEHHQSYKYPDSWVGKMPWRRKWQPTPVFLPGKSVDRGAWRAIVHGVTKKSDTTEQLSTAHSML